MAVLLGDYVFATSAIFVCDTNSVRLIRRFAETIADLSRGELHEMLDAWSPGVTRDDYFARVYDKTASLFSTAAESGAVLGGGDADGVEALRSYGRDMGIAYQIVDDLFDFQCASDELGKPVGHDLGEGVLTLPSLIALHSGKAPGLEEYLAAESSCRPSLLPEAYAQVRASGALSEARGTAEEYLDRAAAALLSVPASEARESLLGLVQYARLRVS